jgi:hypothetical protein
MPYILDIPDIPDLTHEIFRERFSKYYEYLDSVRSRMPESAYAFATADWHYDYGDPRSPHDAWLEEVVVTIHSSGERSEKRWCDLLVRLFGAQHNGYIELRYKNVRRYTLRHASEWYYDEIRLVRGGWVVHEIRFDADTRWRIECEDISFEWKPLK